MLSWKIFLSKIRSSSKILRITTICFSQCCRSSPLLIIQILSFNISQLLCLHFFLFLSSWTSFTFPFTFQFPPPPPREVTLFIFFPALLRAKNHSFYPGYLFTFHLYFPKPLSHLNIWDENILWKIDHYRFKTKLALFKTIR